MVGLLSREQRLSRRKDIGLCMPYPCMFLDSPVAQPDSSEALYKLISKVERDLGGDAGIIGMSGSLYRSDMAKILTAMQIDSQSHFLDVGSGLGRPMLHAIHAGAASASGIEFDAIKHFKCQTVISRVLPIADQIRTCCVHGDVLTIPSLDGVDPDITHIFSFWEGINIDAREAVGRLVTQAWLKHKRVTTVAYVQAHQDHLDSYMCELFFPPEIKLARCFPVSMMGSAAKFQAYIFTLPREPTLSLLSPTTNGWSQKSSSLETKAKRRIQQLESYRAHGLTIHDVVLGDYVLEPRRTRNSLYKEPSVLLPSEALATGHVQGQQPFVVNVELQGMKRASEKPPSPSSSTADSIDKVIERNSATPVPLSTFEVVVGDYVIERRNTRTASATTPVALKHMRIDGQSCETVDEIAQPVMCTPEHGSFGTCKGSRYLQLATPPNSSPRSRERSMTLEEDEITQDYSVTKATAHVFRKHFKSRPPCKYRNRHR